MSMNKYMHPRNIYKVPPDFGKLVKLYDDFAAVSKTNLSGKITIDFKNPNSLRVLTKCLLKSDFGLDVVIPEDRLVPTLSLRLNYILWLEDLLATIKLTSNIKGIDIGTGACAIYPLLAAKKNKWHMLGTETDKDSITIAQQNIDRNELKDYVQLSHNSTGSILKYLFINGDELKFHFTMCNPPFYSNLQELCESRSPARPPPRNGFTGSPQELITEGGELEFCRKMIKESREHPNNVVVYTTMVGHKYTLAELIKDLQADGIKYTHTEFCQGHVTRWGLAWTYQKYDIYKLMPPREKLRKKHTSIIYMLPELPDRVHNVEQGIKKIINIFQELNICYKVVEKRGHKVSVDVLAPTNTWSNQRRKRRLQKQLQEEAKKMKTNDTYDQNMNGKIRSEFSSNFLDNAVALTNTKQSGDNENKNKHIKINRNDDISVNDEECKPMQVVNALVNVFKKEETKKTVTDNSCDQNTNNISNIASNLLNDTVDLNDDNENVINGPKINGNVTSVQDETQPMPVVHALMNIFKKDKDVLMQMEYYEGTAGKEGLHQIVQYIKNNWK